MKKLVCRSLDCYGQGNDSRILNKLVSTGVLFKGCRILLNLFHEGDFTTRQFSDLMALWIAVNDINIFTKEQCYWQNKLKSAGGAPLLLVFWKAQVEGRSLSYSCFYVVIYVIYLEYFLSIDSGKTAMAATVGIESDFPYVKIVSL